MHWHDQPPEVPGANADPEQTALADDQQRQLDVAIAQLPEQQRSALLLVHREGLSNREAAAAMDCSVKALESLLVRGRRHLRDTLNSPFPPDARP